MIPVSVVIPFYKHEKELGRALASVSNQTVLPLEVIIVNDGVIESEVIFFNKLFDLYIDLNLNFIHLPKNIGAAGARNAGWNCASGEYIAFLDADDAWHPQKLQVQYEFMKRNPQLDLTGHKYLISVFEPKWSLNLNLNPSFTSVTLAKLLVVNQFVTPSVMIKKNYPLRFNSAQRYMEDYALWLAMANNRAKMGYLNVELTALYKPEFGVTGLSSHLWEMEKGELFTLWGISKNNLYLLCLLPFLFLYSIIKFIRRIIISNIRNTFPS
jgi:glycosyltransferase involved in cell wall biosynthesis